MLYYRILNSMLLTFLVQTACAGINVQDTRLDDASHQIAVTFDLEPGQAVFKDSLIFSSDNPKVTLSDWHSDKPPKSLYDRSFKTNKLSYADTFTITLTAHKESADVDQATIHVHYLVNTEKHPLSATIPISFADPIKPVQTTSPVKENKPVHHEVVPVQPTKTQGFTVLISNTLQSVIQKIELQIRDWKASVSALVSNTESTPLRCVLVFLLGLLMSLTPCIYPMIPITVGIIQASAVKSITRNFLLAFAYTLGIAITFALLGLLAATGSAQFGALLGNPLFIIMLVLLLGYLGFSMLGLYDMYIPRFMQPKNTAIKNGSFISVFLFGAISGTIASPCLSPGLLLLLSIVATLGNKLLGFILLFSFGMGLGLPLLIIGTFSGSLNVLPRAGLWMVEVKKLFGFMLIIMCFYYLNNIMPWHLMVWLMALCLLTIGIIYIVSIQSYETTFIKRFKNYLGIIFIISSFIVAFYALKLTFWPDTVATDISIWHTDYAQARQKALEENKPLLLDFGASWCSSCKAIEKQLLHQTTVMDALEPLVVPLTVDCTNPHAEPCAVIQQKYGVVGFPTIILVNAATETILKKWGGELLDYSPEEFINELEKLV